MLSSLFLSKIQKLVKKWTKEHEDIVRLTHEVLAEYSKNNHRAAKRILKSLSHLVIDHVTNENLEFYKLLRDENRVSVKNKQYTQEFVSTFKDMRLDLMQFLTKYTQKSAVLDEEFFSTLNQIADVLVERIDFEEENLYRQLYSNDKEEQEWERHKRKF